MEDEKVSRKGVSACVRGNGRIISIIALTIVVCVTSFICGGFEVFFGVLSIASITVAILFGAENIKLKSEVKALKEIMNTNAESVQRIREWKTNNADSNGIENAGLDFEEDPLSDCLTAYTARNKWRDRYIKLGHKLQDIIRSGFREDFKDFCSAISRVDAYIQDTGWSHEAVQRMVRDFERHTGESFATPFALNMYLHNSRLDRNYAEHKYHPLARQVFEFCKEFKLREDCRTYLYERDDHYTILKVIREFKPTCDDPRVNNEFLQFATRVDKTTKDICGHARWWDLELHDVDILLRLPCNEQDTVVKVLRMRRYESDLEMVRKLLSERKGLAFPLSRSEIALLQQWLEQTKGPATPRAR